MRRLILSMGCALAIAAGPGLAEAQPTKTVSGSITAVAADSITVNAAGQDMKFMVDAKTQVIAPGAGTKARAAKAEGKAGTSLTAVLKEGQAVEVKYHEEGMHAASIRTMAALPAPKGPPDTVTGVVSAVTGNSLTVKGASEEWTFAADDKTAVLGTGLGTATKQMKSEGKKPSLPDLLHEGDTVSVKFREVDSTKYASTVRVTRKKR